MDDQTSKILAQTIANLAEVAAKNTVGAISDKIRKAKAGNDKDKTIQELEEIVNDIINDKIELERIAKTLENELISQRISDKDIDFIVKSVIPMMEKLFENDPKQKAFLDAAKTMLSKEILQVMQLIGFNYREGIGLPMTRLCADVIKNSRKTEDEQEITKLNVEYQNNLVQLSRDVDAYNRFVKVICRVDLVARSDNSGNQEGEM